MSLSNYPKTVGFFLILLSISLPLLALEYYLVWENSFEPYPTSPQEISGKIYRFNYPVELLFKKKGNDNVPQRIYLLGDSMVAGDACAKNGTNLSGHLQGLMHKSAEVINLGVGGKDPSNYINFLNHFPITGNDIVLVGLSDNDIHMSRETCELSRRQATDYPIFYPRVCKDILESVSVPKDEQGLLRKINQEIKRFSTVQLAKEAAYNVPGMAEFFYRSEYTPRWEHFDADETKWILSAIPVMKRQVTKKDATFLLFYYPLTNNLTPSDTRHGIWLNFAKELSRRHNIELLDPFPFYLSKATRTSMVWSLTDKHPSCDAHGIMAQFLFEKIKSTDKLRSR